MKDLEKRIGEIGQIASLEFFSSVQTYSQAHHNGAVSCARDAMKIIERLEEKLKQDQKTSNPKSKEFEEHLKTLSKKKFRRISTGETIEVTHMPDGEECEYMFKLDSAIPYFLNKNDFFKHFEEIEKPTESTYKVGEKVYIAWSYPEQATVVKVRDSGILDIHLKSRGTFTYRSKDVSRDRYDKDFMWKVNRWLAYDIRQLEERVSKLENKKFLGIF